LEEEVALVGPALRHLDRPELGLRHAQVLGLAARNLSVHLRVAEERSALVVLMDLGRLTLGEVLPLAHPAVPAGDVEGDDDAVAGLDLGDLGADLLDDPHRLVAEDVALVDEHAEHLVEVQVGAADRGRGDADDRVGRVLDRWVRDLVDADVFGAVVGECFHVSSFVGTVGGTRGTRCVPAVRRGT